MGSKTVNGRKYTRRKVKRGGDSDGFAYYSGSKRLTNAYGRRIWRGLKKGSLTEARGHRKASVEVARRDFRDQFDPEVFPTKRDFRQSPPWQPMFHKAKGRRQKNPLAEYWWAAAFWSAKRRTAYDWYVKVLVAGDSGGLNYDKDWADPDEESEPIPVTLRLVWDTGTEFTPMKIDDVIANFDSVLADSAARARVTIVDPMPIALWRSSKPSTRQSLTVEGGGDE